MKNSNLNASARFIPAVSALLLLAQALAAPCPAETGMKVSGIRIFGNEKIKPYIILRTLPFKPGDFLDEKEIEEAREAIRSIPGVDYSEIRVGYIPRDSSAVVTVVITEKPTLEGHLLVERGYENKLSFGLKALDRNFRGRSETLYASGLFRGNTIIEAGWENPWVLGSVHIGIGFHAFYRDYNYVYDDLGTELKGAGIRRSGFGVRIFRNIGRYNKIAFSGEFERVSSPRSGITSSGRDDRYPTLALSIERDSRKSPAFPWDATFVDLEARYIGPGDEDLSILEGTFDLRKYMSILSRFEMATQILSTLRDGGKIPAYRREHIGGARTLRSYDYGSFNGVNSVVVSTEIRMPLNFSKDEPLEEVLLGLSMQLFAETGAAWERGEEIDSDYFHSSFGIGLSILSTNASGIRFDYGWNTKNSGRWEIDAGLKF